MKWAIRAAGDVELDLRYSLIQPHGGYRQFSSGVSSLKQVTGREHRDIQRYLLALMPEDVDERFILCVRALLNLRYLTQLHWATERDLCTISDMLQLFHEYKQVIINLGLRVGKQGTIHHFQIPKLEILQSLVSCIRWSGTLPQWSADMTERLHIDYIKTPRKNTNGQDYAPQIYRNLDRQEKCWYFNLATQLQDAVSVRPDLNQLDDPDQLFDADNGDWQSEFPDVAQGPNSRQTTDLFTISIKIKSQPNPLRCPRTFSTPTTAFHLNVRANCSHLTIDEVSLQYNIPDLLQGTRDFFSHFLRDQDTHTISGRRGPAWNANIPFKNVQVWHSVHVQTNSQVHSGITLPQKLYASPPSEEWPAGRCDTAMFAEDAISAPPRPPLGLDGKCLAGFIPNQPDSYPGFFVGQIRSIFHPIWDLRTKFPLYLAYVERFDVIPQTHLPRGRRLAPDLIRGMYILRRAYRSNGSPMGAIVPLYHLWQPIQLIPRFGEKADPALTSRTSFATSRDFYLNHYFDKEDFFYMRNSLDM